MHSVTFPVETFTEEERERLALHFTNLDRPVFGLVNLPETVKGALFARYSRYQGTLRRLLRREFAASLPEQPIVEGGEGARAPGAPAGGGLVDGRPLRADLPRLRARLGRPAGRSSSSACWDLPGPQQ